MQKYGAKSVLLNSDNATVAKTALFNSDNATVAKTALLWH
jgi:hypothetical protein